MKFAKVFQQALEENHVPPEWVERAIKYKALKKRINKVVYELESIGISQDEISIHYDLILGNSGIKPVLQLQISPLLKSIIEEKLIELNYHFDITPISRISEISDDSKSCNSSLKSAINPFDDSEPFYQLTISLIQDSKFFQILYDEIEDLNRFKIEVEKDITGKVDSIANEISVLTSPNLKKSDMYIWREIFQMYIECEIFFSTRQRSTGYVDIDLSKEKYTKFLQLVAKSNLINQFKQKESQNAFMDFKRMNDEILMVSNYQSFNSMAVTKILKKFDKQTHLNSKDIFPDIIINSSTMNILKGSIAKDICAIISKNLLSIVPQIDDYLCPVCFSIAFKPIRLHCGHLFCLRCLVKLRRKHEDKCPLCRDENLLSLTTDDLDVGQMNYMKMYFPLEVKEKEKENNKEIIKETYGTDPDSNCVIV